MLNLANNEKNPEMVNASSSFISWTNTKKLANSAHTHAFVKVCLHYARVESEIRGQLNINILLYYDQY